MPPSSHLDKLEDKMLDQLHGVVEVVLKGKLSSLQHGTLENFVIAEVYHMDVVQRLRWV